VRARSWRMKVQPDLRPEEGIYREFRLLFIRGHGVITQAERIERCARGSVTPVINSALMPASG